METTMNTETVCTCGIKNGVGHPESRDKAFGRPVVWNTGYRTAHETATYYRTRGYEARVFSEPGFGWSVQVRK